VIDLHSLDGVVIAELAHGKVNALDVEMMKTIRSTFAGFSEDPAVSAVVLTGRGLAFSAGVDLRRVVDEPKAYTRELIEALHAMLVEFFSFPKPVVAAVNGPAIAGGCVLACACDRRIGSETARIGASELVVGVSFPAAALEILRTASPTNLDEVVFEGGVYEASRAMTLGLLHEVVAPDAVVQRAVEVAASLGTIQAEAFRLAKEHLRGPALELMRSGASRIDATVIRQWEMPDTRKRISEQLARLKKT
jgi:enoyl-CoA hydratase